VDSESKRFLFLKLLREMLNLSHAEVATIDRLIQKIQAGTQLNRDELIYFAEVKRNADIAKISMPTNQPNDPTLCRCCGDM
jgi:hypothetical protein